jgi:uncharacterized membrane protein
MKPLIILVVSFGLSLLAMRYVSGSWDFALSGRISLSVMLLFTALGHFLYPKGMAMMLPGALPLRLAIPVIYITGLIEAAAAVGLLFHRSQASTGILLIVFFILILPANIYAAVRRVDFQKGTLDGPGVGYLWFRVPLQVLFICWTYFSAVR